MRACVCALASACESACAPACARIIYRLTVGDVIDQVLVRCLVCGSPGNRLSIERAEETSHCSAPVPHLFLFAVLKDILGW